jgi:hypothetical protein
MSYRTEVLPSAWPRQDVPDRPFLPGRGVLLALVIAVPFWALIGGVTWALLG